MYYYFRFEDLKLGTYSGSYFRLGVGRVFSGWTGLENAIDCIRLGPRIGLEWQPKVLPGGQSNPEWTAWRDGQSHSGLDWGTMLPPAHQQTSGPADQQFSVATPFHPAQSFSHRVVGG